jgi:hypothetical protein
MSDPLSPLFASLGLSAIEKGINRMAKDMFNLPVETLSAWMLEINGYAYQRVSFTGRQWFQLLAYMGPRVPRMFREGVPYWQNVAHPRYAKVVAHWKEQPVFDLPAVELWSGVQEIMDAFAQHIGSLMASTMGPSAGSEGLFTQVYERMVMRPGDPPAPAFLMGLTSPIRPKTLDLAAGAGATRFASWRKPAVQVAETREPANEVQTIWDASQHFQN